MLEKPVQKMEEASGKHLAHPLGWVSLFRSLLRELFNAAIAGDATASRGESERITAGQNPICTVCRTGFPFPSRCKHTRVKGRTHHETGLRFSRQGGEPALPSHTSQHTSTGRAGSPHHTTDTSSRQRYPQPSG